MNSAEPKLETESETTPQSKQPSFTGLDVGGIAANPFSAIADKKKEAPATESNIKKFVPYSPYDPKKAAKAPPGFHHADAGFSNVQTLILRAHQVSQQTKAVETVATEKPPEQVVDPAPAKSVEKRIFTPQPLEQFPVQKTKSRMWERLPAAARYAAIAVAIVAAHIILVVTLQDEVPKAEVEAISSKNLKAAEVIIPAQQPVVAEIKSQPETTEEKIPVTIAKDIPQIPQAIEMVKPVVKPLEPKKATAKPAVKTTKTTKPVKSEKPQVQTQPNKILKPTYNLNKTEPKKTILVAPATAVKTPTPPAAANERELIEMLNRR